MRVHPVGKQEATRTAGGFGLVELMFSFGVMITIALVLISHTTLSYRADKRRKDRVFAFTKATSLLDELQSHVNRSNQSAGDSLSIFDDGVSYNPVLTITMNGGVPVEPDHPLSGNILRTGDWIWTRRISVQPFAGLNNRNVRYVTVKVFKMNAESGKHELMAEVSRVVNSTATYFPPSQVYDIYLLALENIPGWWVHMDAIKPFIESMITDLEARNPGVSFRTHWITKVGYGRSQAYTPYINEQNDSTAAINSVYFYPGKMPAGSASSYYYVPDNFQARINVDGTIRNGYDATANPWPYALADRFNNCMRLPDERRLFLARVASGQEDPMTPTWRLLLEDMASDPTRFHNAILVNLHGELLPMPPMRNYSDPAKSPGAAQGLRVVTHPERLRYVRGDTVTSSEDVALRVYAWRTEPDGLPPSKIRTEGLPITLQIMDVDLTANVNGTGTGAQTLEIRYLEGGVDRGDGNSLYSPFQNSSTTPAYAKSMYHSVSYVDDSGTGGEKYTLIKLYRTPSISPLVSNRGLSSTQRLYGFSYIPCSVEVQNDFSKDLGTSGAVPKNTARWRIRIPKAVLNLSGTGLSLTDQLLEVRTRLGDDLGTGASYPTQNDPDNLSRTYVYWTRLQSAVPHTERYEFTGDPRHCPYADLKDGGANFPNGYNWYFDDFKTTGQDSQALWPGFDPARLLDRWKGRTEVDFPRLAQLLRTALTESEAVYTTLTGYSYYYLGCGNEIGYDSANGYANSIPVNRHPYGGAATAVGHADNIATGGDVDLRYQKIVRASGSGSYWWGRYWLGELYPDSSYVAWFAAGNLPAGGGAGEFYRVDRSAITVDMPAGTALLSAQRRTRKEGCTSMFNIGTSASSFHHIFAGGTTGTLESAGLELASNYGFPLPTSTMISRPFRLDLSGTVGSEWPFTVDYPRFNAAMEKTYYRHSGGAEGSGLVALSTPGSAKTARIVVNGLDKSIESGSAFIAKYSVISLLHSYFESGHPAATNSTQLPPRLTILTPTEITELADPVSIPITWGIEWKRWDGQKYSQSFPDSYAQDENNLEYVVMYSTDGGSTFKHVQDDSAATPGTRPSDSAHLEADSGLGDETLTLSTPDSKFPEGSYVLRIEAWRVNEALHYAFQQSKIFISR